MTDSSDNTEQWNVKFIPFTSSVDTSFWVRYCREKLETIKLSEDPIPLQISYAVNQTRLICTETSLQENSVAPNEQVLVKGRLIGFNTSEAFQKVDKNELLLDSFRTRFQQGEPSALSSVVLLTFADLKNHKVLYWFGVPALLTKPGKSIQAFRQDVLSDSWTVPQRQSLSQQVSRMRRDMLERRSGLPPYFIYSQTSGACLPLSCESYETLTKEENDENLLFGFFDPTGPIAVTPEMNMGWPMRNMVAFLCIHLNLGGKRVHVLSYRNSRLRRITEEDEKRSNEYDESSDLSLIVTIQVPLKEDYDWNDETTETAKEPKYKAVGWELNARSKPGPRLVNLKPLLDSNHLAIQAADLNLKLMKWRMIPDLNVDLLQSTKVLIIGAGTLGCNVARVLLAWGIRKFKMVDYGKVSYSNPVRQSLFTLEDCHHNGGSGKSKAQAAAEALKTIAADVESEGITLSIPMPGHPENEDAIRSSVDSLDQLMQECDVAFLLTDTRESRWLPTLAAAVHDKIMINAALGVDSWLVMRHGGHCNNKKRLGCYFCNDIVAPENSTRNRTLDQQCTVTRPGLAPIAGSLAVEMVVSLLHHPEGLASPAPESSATSFSPTVSGSHATSLGVVPHQVRGSLVSYTTMTPTVPAFPHCTGCSARLIEAYEADKVGTVVKTCESPDGSYLENLSGLTAFRAEAAEKMDDIDDWDEDDE